MILNGSNVPTWMAASTMDAAARVLLAPGLRASYRMVGYNIFKNRERSYEDDENVLQAERELEFVRYGDYEGALAWLWKYLGRLMKAVPAKRRLQVAMGFLDAYQQ